MTCFLDDIKKYQCSHSGNSLGQYKHSSCISSYTHILWLKWTEPWSLNLTVDRLVFLLFPLHSTGLPSHPQHELMKKQCTGCPGMITFYIKGKLENATMFLSNLKVITKLRRSCVIDTTMPRRAALGWYGYAYNVVAGSDCKDRLYSMNRASLYFTTVCVDSITDGHCNNILCRFFYFKLFALAESLGGYESLAEHP